MKNFLIAVLMFASLSLFGAEVPQAVTDKLQDVSVSVVAVGGQGSGVLVVKNGTTYCITAGHVVADGRKTRTVVDSASKSTKTIVYFNDVKVVKEVVENGRKVQTLIAYAEVIRYSDANVGDDIAVLRLRKHSVSTASTTFYTTKTLPLIGTEVIHVGSIGGVFGFNSMTRGVLSYQGRVVGGKLYDQTSSVGAHGSSGCGIFTNDGSYIGMLVRGGEGFNLIVPIRRMLDWSKRNNAEWLFDDTVKINDDPNAPVENYLEAPSINSGSLDDSEKVKCHFLLNTNEKFYE